MHNGTGPSSHRSNGGRPQGPAPADIRAGEFDISQWYPKYLSCLNYFLGHSQHSYPCQALAAFINIRLPYQKVAPPSKPPPSIYPPSLGQPGHAFGGMPGPSSPAHAFGGMPGAAAPDAPGTGLYGWVSLHFYIRRLVATGFDKSDILFGWFGEDWEDGVRTIVEIERRNFLFAAKSGGWSAVKREYDSVNEETIPFINPLKVFDGEIEHSEEQWSKWLLMEDWMLGSRAPGAGGTDRDNGMGSG